MINNTNEGATCQYFFTHYTQYFSKTRIFNGKGGEFVKIRSVKMSDDHGLISFFSHTGGACDEAEVKVLDLFPFLFEIPCQLIDIFPHPHQRGLRNTRI